MQHSIQINTMRNVLNKCACYNQSQLLPKFLPKYAFFLTLKRNRRSLSTDIQLKIKSLKSRQHTDLRNSYIPATREHMQLQDKELYWMEKTVLKLVHKDHMHKNYHAMSYFKQFLYSKFLPPQFHNLMARAGSKGKWGWLSCNQTQTTDDVSRAAAQDSGLLFCSFGLQHYWFRTFWRNMIIIHFYTLL